MSASSITQQTDKWHLSHLSNIWLKSWLQAVSGTMRFQMSLSIKQQRHKSLFLGLEPILFSFWAVSIILHHKLSLIYWTRKTHFSVVYLYFYVPSMLHVSVRNWKWSKIFTLALWLSFENILRYYNYMLISFSFYILLYDNTIQQWMQVY